mgnify:CR=1 FL=1|jgi:hypothetical protein
MRSFSFPPWGVALAVAASAPFVAKLFAESLKRKKRESTERFLSRVRASRTKDNTTPEGSGVRRTSWHD